ncbi:MAG: GNAT family N-acetyltransferase [Thermoplasmatota archaeon]
MLDELEESRVKMLSSEIGNTQLRITLSSISEGNTEGYLWSDRTEETYFFWDLGNIVFYIFGKDPSSEYLEDLSELLENDIKEKAEDEGFSHFKVNNLTDISEDDVKAVFGDNEYKILKKNFYEYKKESVEQYRSSIDGLEIMDIDEQFLKNTKLRNLARVINEVKWMWPSFQRYYENGFGKAGIIGDEIVCWCTAEYVSEGTCGIGIETLEGYRQKGIASKTASEFIDNCLKNDVKPYWECGTSNEQSVKLAEKLGFDKIDEYQVWLGKF